MLGQLLDGRYRIIQELGAGGFGQTFIAEDTKLYNNQCVVKLLKPQATDPMTLQVAGRLFDAEAQLLHKLGTHDQIPQLLAHFAENKQFFLVQQFIAGHPLSHELTPGKRLSEAYAIALLQNILQPLAFVHQNNVIHRDIKPDNLIRRQGDGKIVLIDFGAVKQISTQVVNAQGQTRMTVGIGTPGYMPSEQSRGSPRFSSDIYAVGMIAIQALTGLMPHELQEDVQTAEILWRHLVPVSPQLADVLDRMIRYDFRQRYQSATEALAAVQHLANPYIPPTQVPSTQPPLYSPPPAVPPQYRQEIPAPSPPTIPPTAVTQISQAEWGFYFQWVLANIGGYIGGLFLGAIVWVFVVISQWFVLRRQISLSFWSWLLTATLAFSLAFLLWIVTSSIFLGFILHGLILGIGQWLVLRRQLNKAGWWVLVNAVGGWIDGGLLSGVVLVWLLRQSRRNIPPTQIPSPQPPLYSPTPVVPPQYRQEIPAPPPHAIPPTAVTQISQPGWGFYFQWVLANIGCYIGGLFLAQIESAAGYIPAFSFWALLVGILQWFVLRPQISLSFWSWLLVTTLAFPLALLFGGGTSFLALHGLIVGIGQWLVLRSQLNKAGWWILVNAFFAGFGGITSGAMLVWLLRQPKRKSNE